MTVSPCQSGKVEPMVHSTRVMAWVTLLATLGACAACRQSTPGAPPPPAQPAPGPATSPIPPSRPSTAWVGSDSATRTATLALEVTKPAGAPSALINGYRAGEARIVVPLGWTITWNWRNADSTAPHSLVVMTQREKIPLEGGRPAFSNAMTRMVTAGLPAGRTDQTSFEADEAGWFWLLCGVPNHAINGEWLELRVDPEATTASVQVKQPVHGSPRAEPFRSEPG
jgi:hypothetical protein